MTEAKRRQEKDLLKTVFFYTFLFGLAAHAYCYCNAFFSHDGISIDQSGDIPLGRFVSNLYLMLRGDLSAPMLVGLLSLLFLAAAVYLVVKIMDMRDRLMIALCCGVLASCSALTFSSASYIPWTDSYMLALLFAVCGVWLYQRYRFGFLFGAAPLFLSLGLYQSYFQVAVVLLLMLLVKRILDGSDAKRTLLDGLKAVAMLLLALLLYYAVYRLLLLVTHSTATDGYNGLANVGNYEGLSIPSLLLYTYSYPLKYFLIPKTYHRGIVAIMNVLLLALGGLALWRVCRAKRIAGLRLALLLLLIVLMPLGMNIVCFIARGMVHALMIFAFFFYYVFVFFLFDYCRRDESVRQIHEARPKGTQRAALLRGAAVAAAAVVIWNAVVFSNRLYLKKELESQATLSVMTRVLDRMEQVPGYVAGETPVAFVGTLSKSSLAMVREDYADITGIGTDSSFAVTYIYTYRQYFKNVLGYPIQIVPDEKIAALAALEEVVIMPAFPATGCCMMHDGVLIVKLSDS